MPGCVPNTLKLAAAAAFTLALGAAGVAQAGDGSVRPNYRFADGTAGFALASHGGPLNPGIIVGFNPQPDPPGDRGTFMDLSDAFAPTLFNSNHGGYRFQFYHTLGDGSVRPLDLPNADGFTGFREVFGAHVVEVTFQFGGGRIDPASWVGFNPQPDPPGDGVAQDFSFIPTTNVPSFRAFDANGAANGDAFVTFHVSVDGNPLSFALPTPEPGTWAMMVLGFGGAGAVLRRRRREAIAA